MTSALPVVKCEGCRDSGWVAIENSNHARPCECQPERLRKARWNRLAISREHQNATLENFDDRGNASLLSARRAAQDFADCWPAVGSSPGLLLMGSCGAGKTHLTVGILRAIVNADKPGQLLLVNWNTTAEDLRGSYADTAERTSREILRPMEQANLLVVDELGRTRPSPFVSDTLYCLINKRYESELPTIFTSNYFDVPPLGHEALVNRIGEALRSRLYSMCETVVFRGVDDFREQGKKARANPPPLPRKSQP